MNYLSRLCSNNNTSHLRGVSTRVFVANHVQIDKSFEDLFHRSTSSYRHPIKLNEARSFTSSTINLSNHQTKAKSNDETTVTTNKGEDKGIFAKIWDRYSFQGQQKRIILGERLFRSAQYRANDP